MGKPEIVRLWQVAGVGAICAVAACRAETGTAQVPAWPAEPAPEYPDAPPVAAEAEAGSAPELRSASPLASEYHGRSALETLTGSATYYADSLAGNKTASGQVYRPELFTAAHRTLPFGSVLRVVRSDVRAITYVTVNDRGPFATPDRIIDLSRAAAKELDMLRAGVVPVRVEVLALPQ